MREEKCLGVKISGIYETLSTSEARGMDCKGISIPAMHVAKILGAIFLEVCKSYKMPFNR